MVRNLVTEYGTWYLNVNDIRELELLNFVRNSLHNSDVTLSPLNGDASLRRYFRIQKQNFIAVDSPPNSQKNQEFVKIDEMLREVGIKAPLIIDKDLERGYFLLEDLGNTTFSNVAIGARRPLYYQKAVAELVKLTLIPKSFALPNFDFAFMQNEVSLFEVWMLKKKLNVVLTENEKQELNLAYEYLLKSIEKMPYIAMHRDFHSRNLMVLPDESLAVIDFQDMVLGPLPYDLASLLYDCYVNLEQNLVDNLIVEAFKYYSKLEILQHIDIDAFKKSLLMVSLQRHIKVFDMPQ